MYTDKDEVLKVVKSNKKARFKYFKSRKDAENFSINGAEIISHDGSSAVSIPIYLAWIMIIFITFNPTVIVTGFIFKFQYFF